MELSRLRREREDVWREGWNLWQDSIYEYGSRYDFEGLPDLDQIGSFTINPKALKLHLERAMEQEQGRLFPKKDTLDVISRGLEECTSLIDRCDEIEKLTQRCRKRLAEL
jgi:hypothetical protein